MLPIILSCPDKAQCDTVIQNFISENAVAQHNIFRIQRVEKKKELSVSQMRELRELFYHQYAEIRIIIIEDYDTASEEAQNALLKILEEKTANTQFFLVVTNPYRVLPTIRSRSQIRILKGASSTTNQDFSKSMQTILSKNSSALGAADITGISAEKAIALCDSLLILLHSSIQSGHTVDTQFMKEVLRIKNLLQENNLNPQLGIDYLILAPRFR